MASTSASTSTSTSKYEEALKFDIGILHLVLQRNRKQHFRAAYFRRLDMVMRSIQRFSILGGDDNDNDNAMHGLSLCQMVTFLREEHDRITSILNRVKAKNKNQMEDQYWTTTTTTTTKASSNASSKKRKTTSNSTSGTSTTTISPIITYTQKLHTILTKQIPNILSRITYASSALYTELSRGYFVPLCTVSLACISRIRILLMKIAYEGCIQYNIMISLFQQSASIIGIHIGNGNGNGNSASAGIIGTSIRKELNLYVDDIKEFLCEKMKQEQDQQQQQQSQLKNQSTNVDVQNIESIMNKWYVDSTDSDHNKFVNEKLNIELRRRYLDCSTSTSTKSGCSSINSVSTSTSTNTNTNTSTTKGTNSEPSTVSIQQKQQPDYLIESNDENSSSTIQQNTHNSNSDPTTTPTVDIAIDAVTTIEDIIGEEIDMSTIGGENDDDDDGNNNQITKDDGDKNLEMVLLLKERNKSSTTTTTKEKNKDTNKNKNKQQLMKQMIQTQVQISKKRSRNGLIKENDDTHDEMEDLKLQQLLLLQEQHKMSISDNTGSSSNIHNEKEKKEKKKKKKAITKKKKKKKKGVIDDIFNGF